MAKRRGKNPEAGKRPKKARVEYIGEVPIEPLKREIARGASAARAFLSSSRKSIHEVILRGTMLPGGVSRAGNRSATYRELKKEYTKLNKLSHDWIGGIIRSVSISFGPQAIEGIKSIVLESIEATGEPVAGFTAPDIQDVTYEHKKRFESDLRALTNPSDRQYLVAQNARRMLDKDIKQLNKLVRDGFKEARRDNLTSPQRASLIQSKWVDLATSGGLDTWDFIDASGKVWDTSNYFAMVNRTITAEVARQAVAESQQQVFGMDLVVIANAGNPCPFCAPWNNVIVSAGGKDDRFPTMSQARASGWAHPNCVCSTLPVIPGVDDKSIEAQANKALPKEPTGEAVREYARGLSDDPEASVIADANTGAQQRIIKAVNG